MGTDGQMCTARRAARGSKRAGRNTAGQSRPTRNGGTVSSLNTIDGFGSITWIVFFFGFSMDMFFYAAFQLNVFCASFSLNRNGRLRRVIMNLK